VLPNRMAFGSPGVSDLPKLRNFVSSNYRTIQFSF
jgi:hypothetical protein